jgi:hypothetical protein
VAANVAAKDVEAAGAIAMIVRPRDNQHEQ